MVVRLSYPCPHYNFIILKKLLFFKRIKAGSVLYKLPDLLPTVVLILYIRIL